MSWPIYAALSLFSFVFLLYGLYGLYANARKGRLEKKSKVESITQENDLDADLFEFYFQIGSGPKIRLTGDFSESLTQAVSAKCMSESPQDSLDKINKAGKE